tara:strand:- start:358 stop:702 length:345 start_codon:yes stop_codon:yes gene_type:complete
MKTKAFLLLSVFPIVLLQACGGGLGGQIEIKASNGSKMTFKKENINCEEADYIRYPVFRCIANGVQTDLTNTQFPFSDRQVCWRGNGADNPGRANMGTFACIAADKFGLLKGFD